MKWALFEVNSVCVIGVSFCTDRIEHFALKEHRVL